MKMSNSTAGLWIGNNPIYITKILSKNMNGQNIFNNISSLDSALLYVPVIVYPFWMLLKNV